LVGCTGGQAPVADRLDDFLTEHGIRYWLPVRSDPRPLRVHHLLIDLDNPRIEPAAALAADPDANGPATAELEPPMSIAGRARPVAMVNANPWQAVPDAAGRRSTNWRAGMAVEALGLAASEGRVRNAPAEGHCEFWTDRQGRAHIGTPGDLPAVREGVAGFGRLVRDGNVVVPAGGSIHPRTALGLDASGRRLHLVVADGRQSGSSEGMSNHEIAAYMRDLGCRDAMNLDGGGSSIMILRERGGALRVVNDPCTKIGSISIPRPIPVALVIRAKTPAVKS
jgi:exopolysaccharide biosynthesis protein